MKSRSFPGRRPLTFSAVSLVVLGATALLGQSCLRNTETVESVLTDSAIDRVQIVIRVFRKLIGRDPGASEVAALKDKTYEELVKAVLASAQFDQEGFYNLHRERLLLNREGSAEWIKNSYDDFCGLRLEMAETAGEDRAGESGYWSILKYRDRWTTLADFGIQDCFFGTTIADVLAAKAAGGDVDNEGDVNDGGAQPVVSEAQMQAKRCVQRVQFGFPVNEGEDQDAVVKAFWEKLAALPEDQRKQSLLYTPLGEELFLKAVKQNLFSDFEKLPEGVTQPKDMKIELTKKDGRPMLVQELGTQGNGQCAFKSLDAATWRRLEQNGLGGGGVDFSNGPTIVFPPFMGTPPQTPLLASQEAAAAAPTADAMSKADGTVYVKLRLPAEYQGIHASPYWLARHTSKKKNRHLHRARALYFSYFCTEINPDAANFQGDPITEFPEPLRPYFAKDDNHVKGSLNCYTCHTKVQPLANFFGITSFGAAYDQTSFDLFENKRWQRYLPEADDETGDQGGFNRPGGIYDGTSFFPAEGTNVGMEGLGNVLSKYPPAKACIVDSAWASLVGRDYPLFDDERKQAVAAFEQNGRASLNALLADLMLKSNRGQAYFTKGEAEFAKIKPVTVFECPETVPAAMEQTALATVSNICADCHNGGFVDADNKFNVDNYFTEGNDDDTPANRGKLWHNLHCKVRLGKMPPGGGLELAQREAIWCYMGRMRDKLAAEGKIPAEYNGKACQGAPAPTPGASTRAAHQVGIGGTH